ncbi:adenylate cyclase [Jiangella asiatica]|uniref:Adenylate cyclase n=1 Tax=Jiangella asiatica TaxID=2530372 RepID=A0A4R5CUM4_9ACTN|nr:adenylate cyclase [Jiangella asiatica]TDE03130.1 adenylate cyclase [Jiangella asiatica]
MTGPVLPVYGDPRLAEIVELLRDVDSVELKLSVPDANQRSAVTSLGMDVLDAQIRQVFFFDTRELALDRAGVVVRARRVQGRPGDMVVKLRPVVPAHLPDDLRAEPGVNVELDAMPGGFVCSVSMKSPVGNEKIKEAVAGRRTMRDLLTKGQRALYRAYAPKGVGLGDLEVLGPFPVLKLRFSPTSYDRRMVAELWNYPDGSRILELSTRCDPRQTFDVAAEARVFLAGRGVDLSGAQQTKTRTALEFFARELAAGDDAV